MNSGFVNVIARAVGRTWNRMDRTRVQRGVTLRGEILRTARMELGLKQVDLAELAGVGERTVRKAETGGTIAPYIAEYLCTALSLSLRDVIQPVVELRPPPNHETVLSEFDQVLGEALLFGKSDSLLSMLAPTPVWYSIAIPIPTACGAWRGRDEIRRYCRIVHHWIRERRHDKRDVSYCNCVCGNSVIYARSVVTLSSSKAEGEYSEAFWSTKLLVVESEGVQTVEQSFGPFKVEHSKYHEDTYQKTGGSCKL